MTTANPPRPLWQKILIIILIVIGLLITVHFGMRAMRAFGVLRHRPFPPPMETDVELIRGWMTIPYIAHVYSVPDVILWESLGIPPMKPAEARRTDLTRLNQQLFPGQQMEVLRRVKQAILDFQAHQPPLPGTPQPAPRTPTP
jgi:heme/copper-type cytochrome/quinol oxidase subunit 2